MISKFKEEFKNFKLGTKVIVYYFVISIISLSFCIFIYQKVNGGIMTEKVSEMSLQTLKTVDENLELLIYNVDNESKILISNLNLQKTLRTGDYGFNYKDQASINRYLTEFIQSNMFISSIYIFDNYGNRYFVDKKDYKAFSLQNIKDSYWYDDIEKLKGGYMVRLNGGGLFNQPNQKYISFMRIFNDLETGKPIGIMIINIPEKAINNSFKNIVSSGEAIIQIKDEYNNDILSTTDLSKYNIKENIKSQMVDNYYYSIEKVQGKSYITSYLENKLRWTIISILPFNELSNQANVSKLIILGLLLLNALLILIGLAIVSSSITKPIDKLINSMKGVEAGEFKKVSIATGNDEIGKLKDVYNAMICKIESLIQQVIEDQKIKRKVELDVLQAQIKPHFLYNSFDTVSSLALDNRNEEVYLLIKSLGSFYRTSLSKGNEVISIKEELQTVKSYLIIQQIRYENLFEVKMDIDERANNYKILKLVLQPLVENSIYHGIKPARRNGNIFISTSLQDDYIELVVQDDGIGISSEMLEWIKNENNGGIGLRGTMERLNIFYNGAVRFELESKVGYGTKITIHVPIDQEASYE
ncbi:MAG: histidine kinase [Bacillota bacterium]|nr:histidine kinase [Bacillota bacterium]